MILAERLREGSTNSSGYSGGSDESQQAASIAFYRETKRRLQSKAKARIEMNNYIKAQYKAMPACLRAW